MVGKVLKGLGYKLVIGEIPMINVNVLVKSDNFKIVASNPLFTEDIFEQLISYAKLQKGVDQPHTTVGAFMEPIIADGGIHKCFTYIYDIQNH